MFYFSYPGNKRNEIKNLDNLLNNVKYTKVVEPFGGSCAFSISEYLKNKELEIYISDIDDELTSFCNNFYKHDEMIMNNVLNFVSNIKNKEEYDRFYKKFCNKIDQSNIVDFCSYYLFKRTCYDIRHGLYYSNKKITLNSLKKNKDYLNEFFKNHTYNCVDYKTIFEQFKNDEDSLLFLDPPYINSNCDLYYGFNNQHINVEELWESIYHLLDTCKCKVILIVNNNFFMRKTFEKWLYTSYDKKYGNHNSKKTIHNVFCNFGK